MRLYQDYLETVLKWVSARDNIDLENYMAEHQNTTNASELWLYFNSVITWVKTIFPNYRKEMQGIEWGLLYNKYGNDKLDPQELEKRIVELMQDDDITKRSGIYEYLLSGEEEHLNIRSFTDTMKRKVYEKQKGICPHCKAEKKEKHIGRLKKWKQTTLHLGVKVVRLKLTTAKCSVKNTIEENQVSRKGVLKWCINVYKLISISISIWYNKNT